MYHYGFEHLIGESIPRMFYPVSEMGEGKQIKDNHEDMVYTNMKCGLKLLDINCDWKKISGG